MQKHTAETRAKMSASHRGHHVTAETRRKLSKALTGRVPTNFRHGYAVGPRFSHEYGCWAMMKQRCMNPKATNYNYYGARGVTVCDEWMSFARFIEAMGPSPSPTHSLDRWPDPAGNYEPGNVRWATKKEQSTNRRG